VRVARILYEIRFTILFHPFYNPLSIRGNRPRNSSFNRRKANILIGERVPNITATFTSTGFVSECVNYVDVGLKFDVEPTVYLDNEVVIKITLEVSNIVSQLQTKSGTGAYQIGARTTSTVLRLKDGENQVLAGLINDEDRRNARKVPGIGGSRWSDDCSAARPTTIRRWRSCCRLLLA
jgi:type II secretory pathway component HofQ